MITYQIIAEYLGTNFVGWQIQRNGLSVQEVLEKVLSKFLKDKIKIIGSGRTDAGVHAKVQCFHFEANWPHPDKKLVRAMHSILDKDIRIESLKKSAMTSMLDFLR